MLKIQKNLSNLFYAIIALPSTAMGFALSIQIAVLSWILSTKYNLNIHEVGIVWAAGPLAGIFGQVIIGLVSDNAWFWGGRRRPFILIGGTLAALMILALPNIDKIQGILGIGSLMAVAIVVAVTLDLAINVSFNPTRSIIADVTPDGNMRTKGYTWMQTISGFWGVMAYLVGAFLGNYFLIYSGAIIVLIFSVIPTFLIEEPRQLEPAHDETVVHEDKETQWIELIKIYLANGFSWIGIQTMFVYIFAFIAEKIFRYTDLSLLQQVQKDEIGQIISISFAILNTVGFILPALVLHPISKKIGRIKTQMICIAIMSLGYWAIVLFGSSVFALYLLMAVVGIGWSAVVSLPFAIMSEKVKKSKMGFFMGVFNLSVVIPQLIVSLGIGYFIQASPDKNLIFIISGSALAISAIFWFLVKEDQKV